MNYLAALHAYEERVLALVGEACLSCFFECFVHERVESFGELTLLITPGHVREAGEVFGASFTDEPVAERFGSVWMCALPTDLFGVFEACIGDGDLTRAGGSG